MNFKLQDELVRCCVGCGWRSGDVLDPEHIVGPCACHSIATHNLKIVTSQKTVQFNIQNDSCDLMFRYQDQVVAKLPFEPHWTIAKVAHRGLKFPKANDCSVVRSHTVCLC